MQLATPVKTECQARPIRRGRRRMTKCVIQLFTLTATPPKKTTNHLTHSHARTHTYIHTYILIHLCLLLSCTHLNYNKHLSTGTSVECGTADTLQRGWGRHRRKVEAPPECTVGDPNKILRKFKCPQAPAVKTRSKWNSAINLSHHQPTDDLLVQINKPDRNYEF